MDEITEPESESRDSNNPPKVFDINMSMIIKKALLQLYDDNII